MIKELIAEHYISKIVPSPYFTSATPVNKKELLFPRFYEDIENVLMKYLQLNKDNDCPYIYETYRSHSLQHTYFMRGASQIRGGNILSAGMHHFGIAVDIINLKDKDGDTEKDPNEVVDWENLDYVLLHKIAEGKDLFRLKFELAHLQFVRTGDQDLVRRAVYDRVLTFQKENGLTVDGIVGIQTIRKAKEIYNV